MWEQGSCGLEDRDSLKEGGVEEGERVGTGELGKGPPGGGMNIEAGGREGGARRGQGLWEGARAGSSG